MSHRLNVDPSYKPVRQKRRPMTPECYAALKEEVDKLLDNGFIREAQIDQLVDATARHQLLSFMDTYSGYNQIPMNPSEEEHTSFITDCGLYCYKVMPFELKNPGATYQRLVNTMFETQIGRTMEELPHETKSTEVRFWSGFREILGIHGQQQRHRGQPEKNKGLAGYEISHKDEGCVEPYRSGRCPEPLKAYMGQAPLLSKPKDGEKLVVYLGVSEHALSAALVREEEGGAIPRLLRQQEVGGHGNKILQKPDTLGRLLKWAIELAQFDLEYKPRTAIKGQALVDFIAEFTGPAQVGEEASEGLSWELYVDGSSSDQGAGARVMLISPEGHRILCALRFGFQATNNEAEYEALLAGLRLAKEVQAEAVVIFSDSQLVVNEIRGEYQVKGAKMAAYLLKVRELLAFLPKFEVCQIPHSQNSHADALARLETARDAKFLGAIPMEFLAAPSTEQSAETMVIGAPHDSWMSPILEYLQGGKLPIDKLEAH
ncbi:uncharacterized protein LOC127804391 [Diospyros lotus]|uniref:uncharacterized protein LOC127804391 n=1 Tax=Diospyros lotus TaxID=55363 RepID=UPI00224F6871|nr:uncharacterized protein LOC127804391 [Diospyros lotus]